jgi:shikimate kinase
VEADLAAPAAPPGHLQADERRRRAGGAQEAVVGLKPPARVVLIGYTGAGKSTVGALVAARLGWPHLDVDEALERRLGPIPAYLASHGMMEFRTAERAVLRERLAAGPMVVSAGAGSVLPPPTRRLLCRGARVFFLDVPAPLLAARLAALPADRLHRPDLLEGDAAAAVGAGLEARRALYERLGVRVDGSASPAAVADAVLRLVAAPAGA